MKISFPERLVCASKSLWIFPLVFALQSVFGMATAGQDLNALFADKLPPGTTPVAATWVQGNIFLPASALKNKGNDHLNIFAKKDNWAETAKDKHLKEGVRLPAVLYMHGCTGFYSGRRYATYFLDQGFAVFAPNSYARPGRVDECDIRGWWDSKLIRRTEELEYTLSKIRGIEWIDQSRLILAGFSSGGLTVAHWSGNEFIAHVIMGADCRTTDGYPNAPLNIPVLNLIGTNDDWLTRNGCFLGDERPKSSKLVIVPGGNHSMTNSEIPRLAIAEFLKACCAQ